jgi:hypothetical protein
LFIFSEYIFVTHPGQTALQVIPVPANSNATDFVKPTKPNLAAT